MAESAAYRRGVALFDYTAIESDELSFRRGATIVIFGSPEEGLVCVCSRVIQTVVLDDFESYFRQVVRRRIRWSGRNVVSPKL